MKKSAVLRFLLLIAAVVWPAFVAFAQSEWTYVVTGKAGKEGLQAYYVSGEPAFTLKQGDRIEISGFRDDFPVKESPGKTRSGVVMTRDMEDYIIYLDEEGLIVPQSKYRYERILPGLGDLVNRNPGKSPAALLLGAAYLLMVLYGSRGLYFIQARSRRLSGAAGWLFLAFYLAVVACEAGVMLTFSNPFWFLSFSEVGLIKGLLYLLLMIVYLYLKYAATLLALYPLQRLHQLEDTPFDATRALLIIVVGSWLILSMVFWEGSYVHYLMGAVGVATLVGTILSLRTVFRVAGPLLSIAILAILLISGTTLCYAACEVLAKIIQVIIACFCIYALISSASMKSPATVSSDAPEHTTYIDFEGNSHDLYRQSDGSYVDYSDNSHWNRIPGCNSDRFDRIS